MPDLAREALASVDLAAEHADAAIQAILREPGIPTVVRAQLVRAQHRVAQLAAMLGDDPLATRPRDARTAVDEASARLLGLVPRPRLPSSTTHQRRLNELTRIAIGAFVGAALSNEARHGSQIGIAIDVADEDRHITARRIGRVLPAMGWHPLLDPQAEIRAGFGLRLVAQRAARAGAEVFVAVDADAVALRLALPAPSDVDTADVDVLSARAEAALLTMRSHGAGTPLAEVRPLVSAAGAAALTAVLQELGRAEERCRIAVDARLRSLD